MLDDPEVDAIVVATSDRTRWRSWRARVKDVCGETSSIWDGQQMIGGPEVWAFDPGGHADPQRPVSSRPRLHQQQETGRYRQHGSTWCRRTDRTCRGAAGSRGAGLHTWCGPSPMLPYRPGRWFQNY